MMTIDIPKSTWLSSNQRLDRHVVAERVATLRMLGRNAANLSGERYLVANCLVTVGYPPRVGIADSGNAYPAAKAALDGAVDAHLLPNDDSKHIPILSFTRGDSTRQAGMYRLTFTFTDQEVPA